MGFLRFSDKLVRNKRLQQNFNISHKNSLFRVRNIAGMLSVAYGYDHFHRISHSVFSAEDVP